jgi:PAS domain S-box-containing protein
LKSGGYAWAEATVSFIRDANGEPSAIMGVTRDISERKAAEEMLSESEKKYRNLFENGSDIICIHDLQGNLLETNLAYKTEYGWRQDDLDGVNIRQMITERYRSKFDAYIDRIIANGSDAGYLNAFSRSGREVILEYRNRLIRDGDGQPVAVQGAARDVTERIEYEKALKVSKEKYEELVRHAPAGIFEVDLETMTFISVNDVICSYTGYTKDAFMQMDPLALFDDASREKAIQRLEQVFATHQDPVPAEYRIQGKNGKTFTVIMNSKFFFEDGVPKRLMTVVHDLTEIRRAEEEKRALEKKLAHAKKLESLGALAGGVAHDLNNILSGIVSYPDLLLMDIDADSPLRQPLLSIKQSGQKAAELIGRALDGAD